MKERDFKATNYRDEDFSRNPNGYTVAPFCNAETTSTAFCEGWDQAMQSEAVRRLLSEVNRCVSDESLLKLTPEGMNLAVNLILIKALEAFRKETESG